MLNIFVCFSALWFFTDEYSRYGYPNKKKLLFRCESTITDICRLRNNLLGVHFFNKNIYCNLQHRLLRL